MQVVRSEIRARSTKPAAAKQVAAELRLAGLSPRGDKVEAYHHALRALDAAYTTASQALHDRIQRPLMDTDELSALGANYAWLTERRRLVRSLLECQPAALAYAGLDFEEPDHIRSLAETATELAREFHSLLSAIAILSYIDQEFGWTTVVETAGSA